MNYNSETRTREWEFHFVTKKMRLDRVVEGGSNVDVCHPVGSAYGDSISATESKPTGTTVDHITDKFLY